MGFDFDAAVGAPFRMQPGLRRLAAGAPQLTPSVVPHRGSARHLREKLAVFGAFPAQSLCAVPGFDAGPALDALADQAAAEQPEAWAVAGRRWSAHWLGWSVDADDLPLARHDAWPEVGALLRQTPPAWRRAVLLSLAFAEDFAVVDATSGTLPWLAVALPSMWAPEDKVGRHFGAVHAPVADNALLLAAADGLLQLVTGGERWERFVWTFSHQPRLHAHPQRVDPARWPAGLDDEALANCTWWRTEHQTFVPVPGRAQAVFTIHVQTCPLRAALTAAQAARVHEALASMSAAVLAYRGLTAVQPALLRWLRQRASQPDPLLHAGPDPDHR